MHNFKENKTAWFGKIQACKTEW